MIIIIQNLKQKVDVSAGNIAIAKYNHDLLSDATIATQLEPLPYKL